jgi:hypothetical protein
MKARTLLLLSALALVVGCGSAGGEVAGSPSSEYATTAKSEAMDMGAGAAPARMSNEAMSRNSQSGGSVAQLVSNEIPAMERNVVKTGSLTVQVEAADKAEKLARQIAETAGGRVDQVQSSDLAGPSATIDMTLRIPVGRFEGTMEKLEALGTRMAKQVAVDDVTEQLIDMNARMKTMLAQEEVVRNMLRKANNLSDSLTINNDLTRLRGEIESIGAQRKSLASQAAYSTLQVRLTQKQTAVAMASTDPNWFQTSWASAWGSGTAAFRSVVSGGMWLVVFSPVWIALLLGCRWLIKVAAKGAPTSSASAEGPRPV